MLEELGTAQLFIKITFSVTIAAILECNDYGLSVENELRDIQMFLFPAHGHQYPYHLHSRKGKPSFSASLLTPFCRI